MKSGRFAHFSRQAGTRVILPDYLSVAPLPSLPPQRDRRRDLKPRLLLRRGFLLGRQSERAVFLSVTKLPMAPTKSIGTVEDEHGRACHVRWDGETGVIQVRVYHFPSASRRVGSG